MSLILEALKKLDREKQVPERGLLVMAAAPWPSSSRGGTPALVLGLLLAMGTGAGLAYWLLRPAPTSGAAPAAAATAPPIGAPAAAPPTPAITPAAVDAPAPTPFPTPASVETAPPPKAPAPRPAATPATAPERSSRPVAAARPTPPAPAPAPTAAPARALASPTQDRAAPANAAPRTPVPASAVPPLAPPFTLEAISLRDGSPIAVINGRLLHEGDVTNGITVVKIGTESVELEIKGVRQIVRF